MKLFNSDIIILLTCKLITSHNRIQASSLKNQLNLFLIKLEILLLLLLELKRRYFTFIDNKTHEILELNKHDSITSNRCVYLHM